MAEKAHSGSGSGARRYAEAAFGLARDTGAEDQWREDLRTIADLVEYPDAARFLASERVSQADKRRLVEAGLRDLSPLALNLARLLLQRGRLSLAPAILREYDAMLDEARGIKHAVVTTAVPLDEPGQRAVTERLRQITGAREIRIETRVDPSILGGMVARVGDRLIDGSTRSRLIQLKRQLAGAVS